MPSIPTPAPAARNRLAPTRLARRGAALRLARALTRAGRTSRVNSRGAHRA